MLIEFIIKMLIFYIKIIYLFVIFFFTLKIYIMNTIEYQREELYMYVTTILEKNPNANLEEIRYVLTETNKYKLVTSKEGFDNDLILIYKIVETRRKLNMQNSNEKLWAWYSTNTVNNRSRFDGPIHIYINFFTNKEVRCTYITSGVEAKDPYKGKSDIEFRGEVHLFVRNEVCKSAAGFCCNCWIAIENILIRNDLFCSDICHKKYTEINENFKSDVMSSNDEDDDMPSLCEIK
jgi:hypothetical protein